MKTIAIRADGGLKIGLGHIMRTLVLAKELSKKHYVYYICKNDDEFKSGNKMVLDNGFEVKTQKDKNEADIIIIDSYDVDENYFHNLKNKYNTIMYIDDLNCFDFYDVDIILNRNLGAEHLIYNIPKNAIKLLGTEYMLLRQEFRNIKKFEINNSISNILITFGGADPKNTTLKILNYIKELKYTFKVIIGNSFSSENINFLKKLAYENNKIELYYSPPKIAELFSTCDLAITACGGTIYELSSIGIPSIGVIIAENQIKIAEYADKMNIIKLAGKENTINKQSIISTIMEFSNDNQKRTEMSNIQKKSINVNGIFKIIDKINEKSL